MAVSISILRPAPPLIRLVTGLVTELEGRLAPGAAGHDELIDAGLASEVGEALGLRRIDLLIVATGRSRTP